MSAAPSSSSLSPARSAHSLPPVWLLLLIVGFPLFSETVYTPSLPSIAEGMKCSVMQAENTLTIYLFGFACGTIVWGKLSDHIGRKNSLLIGMAIYSLACWGCYLAPDISLLTFMRFLQAFGGSSGSVLGQTICRDSFHGRELGRVYAAIGTAISVFPAIGPVLGGMVAQHTAWQNIFLILMGVAALICSCLIGILPETRPAPATMPNHRLLVVGRRMFSSPKVVGCMMIVGICQGVGFSYFSEAPFIFINRLGLTPSQYGFTFTIVAIAGVAGGIITSRLQKRHEALTILRWGSWFNLAGALFFLATTTAYEVFGISPEMAISCCILSQMVIRIGTSFSMINALTICLEGYKRSIGTASSIFSLATYCLTAGINLLMSTLHNGQATTMPAYFTVLFVVVLLTNFMVVGRREKVVGDEGA